MAFQLVEDQGGDYSYFNAKMLENWAGPSHWRFKKAAPSLISRAKADSDAQGKTLIEEELAEVDDDGNLIVPKESAKKSTRKKAFTIDFQSISKNNPALEAAFQPGGKETVFSALADKKQAEKATDLLLPEDHHYDAANFTRLFNMPKMTFKFNRTAGPARPGTPGMKSTAVEGAANVAAEPGAQWVNEDFAPEFGGGDDDDGGMPLDGHELPPMFNTELDAELKIMHSPTKVAKVNVPFATAAKNVDVKALKRHMWEHVEESTEAPKPGKPPSSITFQEVISEMPQYIENQALSNITVPYYFICLLHLCNENHLRLERQDDGDVKVIRY